MRIKKLHMNYTIKVFVAVLFFLTNSLCSISQENTDGNQQFTYEIRIQGVNSDADAKRIDEVLRPVFDQATRYNEEKKVIYFVTEARVPEERLKDYLLDNALILVSYNSEYKEKVRTNSLTINN